MKSRWLAYRLLFVGLILIGVACKGDGEPESQYIQVLVIEPETGRTDVPVLARIGFRIDARIDAETLSSETFFLTDGDGVRVPATVFVGVDDEATAELRPDESLAVLTTFTVTVTTGLRSTDGRSLEQDYEWTFTTLDATWGVAEWLEELGTGTASQPQIAVDGQLNALSVWRYADFREEPNPTFLYANRYTRKDLWGDPVQIDDGSGSAENPKLAADDAGHGFAIWERRTGSGTSSNIWTNRCDTDGVWGTAELLQNGEVTPAGRASLAADPAGNAIAVWAQDDLITLGAQVVWAIRYDSVAGWGAAASIDNGVPTGGQLVINTAVGMDDAGRAIAIWSRQTVGGNVIWANRFTPGSGWGTAELIKADTETSAVGARLDVGPSGDAFAVWVQKEGTRDDIWGARFSGSSWEAPQRLDVNDEVPKRDPDVAVDGSGVAHVVWSQRDPDFANIYARQYSPGSGWDAEPELIEPPNEKPEDDSDAINPRIAVNAEGNAFVVWNQNDADWASVWSNHFDPGTGWMVAQTIEKRDRAAGLPRIAVDAARHAHAVWPHSHAPGEDWVRTNRFE